jgi:hypothetical protein
VGLLPQAHSYEEEERLGLHEKKGKVTARKGRKARNAEALSLFGVTAGE